MEDGRWVTMNGTHVFIKEGQNPMDAFIKQKGKNKKEEMSKEELEEKTLDVVNNGQVFVFSVGPQMTICSRYENGDYRWFSSSGDSPMNAFEQEIIPYVKDEFVVVDWEGSKRASRFKKFGYEEVGKIKPKKYDIATGNYINEDLSYDKGDEWHLMRKKNKE